MLTDPGMLLELAKQRQADLIDNARRFRLTRRLTEEHLARPAPAPVRRVADLDRKNNVGPAGTLSVCDSPRELTAGRAR
jgi:hypothetical protein